MVSGGAAPLRIFGVNSFEMEAFLEIMQARCVTTGLPEPSFTARHRVTDGPPPLTFHQFAGALRLAKLWNFGSLKTYITKELDAMATKKDPVGCIEAANLQTYDVRDWLLKALEVLIERDTPLSLEEASRLTLAQTITICNLRVSRKPCSSCTNASGYDTATALKEHEALFTPHVGELVVKPHTDNPERHPRYYQPDLQELLVRRRSPRTTSRIKPSLLV